MVRILNFMEKLIQVACQLFLALIVVVIFYAVVMRYIFYRPPAWSEELSRFTFIWMIMMSAVLVTREQSHINISFFIDLLPRKIKWIILNLIRLLMIGFCWIMIQQGLKIYPIVAQAASPSFGISMGWLYLSIPVGGVLMGIYIVEAMVRSVVDLTK